MRIFAFDRSEFFLSGTALPGDAHAVPRRCARRRIECPSPCGSASPDHRHHAGSDVGRGVRAVARSTAGGSPARGAVVSGSITLNGTATLPLVKGLSVSYDRINGDVFYNTLAGYRRRQSRSVTFGSAGAPNTCNGYMATTFLETCEAATFVLPVDPRGGFVPTATFLTGGGDYFTAFPFPFRLNVTIFAI